MSSAGDIKEFSVQINIHPKLNSKFRKIFFILYFFHFN